MANSSVVTILKDKIIKEIIQDDLIVRAIDSPDIEENDELVNTHIFRYNKNPNLVSKTITFITIQVHVKSNFRGNGIWVNPTLEIIIYSHDDHIKITNIPLIKDNRNDYLASLIDKKFNGRSDLAGYGKMELTSNVEGAFNDKFLYRRLVFETRDINNSLCGGGL